MRLLKVCCVASVALLCATAAFARGPLLAQAGPKLGTGVVLGQAAPPANQPVPMPAPGLNVPPAAPSYSPAPGAFAQSPVPMPAAPAPVGMQPIAAAPSAELYSCVKYRDVRKIHCNAVPMVVMVKDPCSVCDPCCPPKCVAVQICVPPCDCGNICCSRDGNKVCYNYGKCKVEITTTRRGITVDYDS